MTEISVSEAAIAGIKLIGRRPLSVLTWGLFIVLLVYGPVLAVAWTAIPDIVNFVRDAQAHPPVPPTLASMQPLFARVGAIYSIMIAGALVAAAVVNAAVYRAVLEPNNRGFAYLRFGMREVWLIVLYVAEILLFAVLICLGVAAVAMICVATSQAAGRGWAVLAGLLGGLAVVVGLVTTALRLSMAAPMTFAASEFRLFQSWRVTRGHAGQIFLVAVLLFVILIAFGILVRVIEEIGFIPLRTFVADPQAGQKIAALFNQSPEAVLRAIWPGLAALFGFLAVYLGLTRTIIAAPWATVYRMLRPDSTPA